MTVQELAEKAGGRVEGDPSVAISGVASLLEARGGDLSFLANSKYANQVPQTQAACVILPEDYVGACSAPAVIRSANPDKAFAVLVPLFAPPPIVRTPGIHPTALIAETVRLGANVHVGPYTIIEDGAVIGDACCIEAQVFIGPNVVIGGGTRIYPQVVVREYCRIGERCILHAGVRIGTDGYGYTVGFKNGAPHIEKIDQVGIVELGSDVEVGANTTIDRARFGRTKIGNCVKIDNLVQIGHNVQVGDFTGIIAQVGISGSTHVGSGVIMWGQAGISGHLHIGDRAQIGPQCGVMKDVPAGEYFMGTPGLSKREFVQNVLTVPKQIEKLKKRIAELEARLKEIQ